MYHPGRLIYSSYNIPVILLTRANVSKMQNHVSACFGSLYWNVPTSFILPLSDMSAAQVKTGAQNLYLWRSDMEVGGGKVREMPFDGSGPT